MKEFVFSLTNENISKHIEIVRAAGIERRAESKMLTVTCLALEEIMLNYQEYFSEEQEVTLKMKKRFGDFVCTVLLQGSKFNPVRNDSSGDILPALDLTPRYSYTSNTNLVTVACKTNQGARALWTLLISVLLGAGIGFLGQFMPEAALEHALTLLNAFVDAIFGLMKMAALPVVFLCVIYGVLGSGSVRLFKQNGVRMLRRFFGSTLCMIILISAISIAAFGIQITHGSDEISAFDTVVERVFDMIPNNIFAAFAEGNNVQVILLGLLFGCALLALGDKADGISRDCCQLKEVCSTVMSWVSTLIPVLIVGVIASNMWSGNIGPELFSAWIMVAVYFAAILCIFVFKVIRTARVCRITVKELLSTILIPGLKGLVSSSTVFCYADMDEGLRNRLKVPETTANFALPLGFAFYQPTALLYAVFVLYYSNVSGIEVSPTWLISFVIICFVMGIAIPPVSGGCLTLLAALFVSFGIGEAATATALPLMMLLDYPGTAFRVMMLMMEIAIENASSGKKA